MSSLKPTVLGVSIALPLVATAAVVVRFHARLTKRIALGADDWLIIAALAFCYALSAVTIAAVELGNLGGHLVFGPGFVPVNVEEFTLFQQILWILSFISIPALGLTKLSVLFIYKRIFVSRSFVITVWTVIYIVIAWTIALFFVNLLVCLPFELNWHAYAGASGKCLDIMNIFWVTNITDIFTDALILALPTPQILRLQMSTTRKLQVISIFGLGFLVVGAGIARTYLSAPGVSSQTSDLDYTYSRAPAVYWLVIEANIAIVSACLPVFKQSVLVMKLSGLGSSLSKILSLSSSSSRSKGSSSSKAPSSQGSSTIKGGVSSRHLFRVPSSDEDGGPHESSFARQSPPLSKRSQATLESVPMRLFEGQHPDGLEFSREYVDPSEKV